MSTVFRVFKTEKFSVISNYHLFDKRLTHKATNLLTTMLALSPVWDYTLEGLASLKKDGIDGVRSGIRELEKLGYLTRRQLRNEKGQLAHNEYLVYETPELNPNFAKSKKIPSLENPITDKKINSPSLENPSTENPTQLNTKLLNTKYTNQSYQDNNNININNTYRCDEMDSIDKIDRKEIKAELKKQLSYENLISRNKADKKQINSIINILADVMSSRSQSIRIGGENKPLEEVIQRFKQLTDKHIAYVLECLNKNADKPRNIRAYLLTSLFNAPSTMDCYYARDADQAETKQYSFDIEEIKSLTNSFSGL